MTRSNGILLTRLTPLVALGIGWEWSVSGQYGLHRHALQPLNVGLIEVRANVLQGRVDLYNPPFGDATRNVESARTELAADTSRASRLTTPASTSVISES